MNRIVRLVIEDAEAVALAEELASRAGLSVEEAVKDLLRRARDEASSFPGKRPADDTPSDRIARVNALVREFNRYVTPDQRAAVMDESWLYDEHGLPR